MNLEAGAPALAAEVKRCREQARRVYYGAVSERKNSDYNNNSTGRTREYTASAGAVVRSEPRRGKGNIVCRIFADSLRLR